MALSAAASGARPIEDHALLGDGETVALVDRTGAIDWLCWPRVDSEAVFCALLGTEDNGFWRIAPRAPGAEVTRRYREGTLVLETCFETPDGAIEVVDALPVGTAGRHLVRIVRGVRGRVRVRSELVIRLAYGLTRPWVTNEEGVLCATGGENRLVLRGPVKHVGRHFRSIADFEIGAGEELAFDLCHGLSYEPVPQAIDAHAALEDTTRHWREWIARARVNGGPHAEIVRRSLLTLKALSNARTGGIVAAATTSLPERPGGTRNWDYRYCWIRDSTLTLLALLQTGFVEEARAWRDWLLRACAGSPADMQIMYGVGGERLLPEWEAHWLAGHGGARPVRIGNAASGQRQLDIFGEVADVLFQSVVFGEQPDEQGLQRGLAVLRHVATIWRDPDYGMWEVRGEPRHFTHSKVMAWVAVDRFVRLVEQLRAERIDLAPWRALRDEMHAWICRHCVDAQGGHFVQHADGRGLDAALLMLPLVGFLPADDPRMVATVAAIERELVRDGLVCRYVTDPELDGLPRGEGAFLACSFWLVDNFVLQGRIDEARALYGRLVALCNDVGLLSEEYDPADRRMLGNFPQAFSHVGIVNSALNLVRAAGPAKQRAELG